MGPMSDGVELDPQMHVTVLQNQLAQATIRNAQLETALQSALSRAAQLEMQLRDGLNTEIGVDDRTSE